MNRNTATQNSSYDEIISLITRIDDFNLMRNFFSELFTDSELRDIALRWELIKRLKRGDSQRKISSELGVSLCKITRGSKLIKNDSSAVNRLLSD
ncbi:Trp family transcriptional regulator [Chitinispirillales bacterium ANBcel5]|uniref:Trp family transcriptional regulator n=1 Tax=Cellulosispirillum alkaliphilum TaxID=3039283 RepID=UPI002A53CA00|nr:Trp family transcriptional regulator [Chitinispirillales bacterium ANBcel5]